MVPPDDTLSPANSTIPAREPVTLVKGIHRWTFSCDAGDEPELLRRLSELASRQDAPFDWFDAALVTHQLNRRLMPGLRRIDGRPADAAQPPHPA
ncbi:MAG: hypothetical protein ACK4WH_13035 [Phycisphaerales bacterium]